MKIDNPQGAYYGGLTAAPVTKAVLEAALASRNAALDRGTLRGEPAQATTAARARGRAAAPTAQPTRDAARARSRERAATDSRGHDAVRRDAARADAAPRRGRSPPRAVPDVHGLLAAPRGARAARGGLPRAARRAARRAAPRPRPARSRRRARSSASPARRERVLARGDPSTRCATPGCSSASAARCRETIDVDHRRQPRRARRRAVRRRARHGARRPRLSRRPRSAGAAVAVVDDRVAHDAARARRAATRAAPPRSPRPRSTASRRAQLRLVGVTGTNGKTTTVGMLRHLLDEPDARAASIGTLGVLIGSEGAPLDGGSGLTTPGPVELQRVLRALRRRGVAHGRDGDVVARAAPAPRRGAARSTRRVFTNLTRDHLDYHGTMEAYFAAKALLVGHLAPRRRRRGQRRRSRVGRRCRARRARVRFGARRAPPTCTRRTCASRRAAARGRSSSDGEPHAVALPLHRRLQRRQRARRRGVRRGRSACRRGRSRARLVDACRRCRAGWRSSTSGPTVLRDYAHTPDALERALDAVRPFTTRPADRRLRLRRRSRPRQAARDGRIAAASAPTSPS